MREQYDVVVVGGGTAGVVAAIQAGRAGASTLLVEKNGMLGGTLTVAGVNAPAHFFAWGEQITGGIGWELVCRARAEEGLPLPDVAEVRRQGKPVTLGFNRPIFAALCDQAVLEAGVDLLLHAMPAAVAFAEGQWTIQVCTKLGLRHTRARMLIDATGDANAVQLAGFAVVRPETVQPATLVMNCAGYDPLTLDYAALRQAAEAAIAAGELLTTDVSWHGDGPEAFLRRFGFNANHLRAPSAESSEGRTAAEVAARQALLRLVRFMRRQPGLEKFHVEWICAEAGIRETVTIVGKTTMRVAEYEAGYRYPDALCYAFYPIDEHLNDGRGINYRRLIRPVLPTIPRGALLPAGSRNLLVAGRCLASDRETNSAVRVECPCMAMGQAAGVMAALGARSGRDPETLPLPEIFDLLRAHGAILPGDVVVSAEAPPQ